MLLSDISVSLDSPFQADSHENRSKLEDSKWFAIFLLTFAAVQLLKFIRKKWKSRDIEHW
jgi:hypothetical protein